MSEVLAFVDVDYHRAAGANGRRRVKTRAPEIWAVARSGIVWARREAGDVVVTGQNTIAGREPVTRTIAALERADLVIGHGLLSSDYRAMAMVAALPDRLVDRTIDTLLVTHRLRGGRTPAGLNLSFLSDHNLASGRRKKAAPWAAPDGRLVPAPTTGHDSDPPTEDADLVRRLWQTILTTELVAWGRSQDEARIVALDPRSLAQLRGTEQLLSATEWRDGIRTDGRVLRPTTRDLAAAELARLADRTHDADLQPLREVWNDLAGEGFEPAPLMREELLAGVQYLPPAGNITLRRRLTTGRPISERLLDQYAWALWRSQNPGQLATWVPAAVDAKNYRRHDLREALTRIQAEERDAVVARRRGAQASAA